MKLHVFILYLGLLLLCIPECSGQTPFDYWNITRLTQDDGLSQGSNYFRFEDSKGFMWITCNDAVNRYDGKMVKVYNLNKYFKDCPNLQQGYGFAEDNESNIYIGSTSGLYIYHRTRDKFTLQKIFNDAADEVAMPFAFKNNKIWCFNRQYQIAAYDVTTKKITFVIQLNVTPIESVHIYQLSGNAFYFRFPFIDKHDNIWMMNENTIACYNIESRTSSYPLKKYSDKNKMVIHSSSYDSITNNLLIGTENGIVEYNITDRKIKVIKELRNKKLGIIESISSGKNMIAFGGNGPLVFANKTFTRFIWADDSKRNKYKRCFQFAFDKSDRLWMCDDGQGEIVLDFHPPLLNKEPNENSSVNYLASSGVSTLAELPDGDIIIQGEIIQSKENKSLTGFPSILPKNSLLRITSDNYRNGVWFFAELYNVGKRILFYTKNNELNTVFYDPPIDSLGQLQDLQVLTGGRVMCSFATGLYWLNIETKSLEKLKEILQLNPFKINILSNNRIAVSYLNNDMLLVRLLPGNSVQLMQKLLPGVQSFYMQEDTVRKQFWVGTNKGIYLLDNNLNPIKLFDANNGLAGTYIYGLLLDDEGNAWCSHQRGLSSINSRSFQIINYDKSDGIQDWDFNNRAFYKTRDGTLYFGGVKGFNYFKPPLQPFSFYKPEVYIDEILVNNKTYLPDTNADLIQKLNLSFTENDISFKAIVKDLDNAGSMQLVYRIKETDATWKYLPNNRIISFNSLAPGTYTLELGVYDKYNNKETHQKTIVISIASPFYRKTWFWALLAILLTSLLLGLYSRRRFGKQQIAFQQQLALEQQRNKITADLHDDIGASLSSLQVNSAVANQLISKNPGQAQQVLAKIESQSRDLADKIGDIIWSMKPGKDGFMSMSSRIKNFAIDIIGATDIHYQIQVDEKADTEIKDITVRKNIVLITKEAINNAVKYSKASLLLIALVKKQARFLLNITDDGIGFTTDEITGNGIANMRKRAEEIKGLFTIDTAPGQGTAISVSIPIP